METVSLARCSTRESRILCFLTSTSSLRHQSWAVGAFIYAWVLSFTVYAAGRPAHYVVTHNENPELNSDTWVVMTFAVSLGLTLRSLQQLSYDLCYTYQRATRSVSIPAPTYCKSTVSPACLPSHTFRCRRRCKSHIWSQPYLAQPWSREVRRLVACHSTLRATRLQCRGRDVSSLWRRVLTCLIAARLPSQQVHVPSRLRLQRRWKRSVWTAHRQPAAAAPEQIWTDAPQGCG